MTTAEWLAVVAAGGLPALGLAAMWGRFSERISNIEKAQGSTGEMLNAINQLRLDLLAMLHEVSDRVLTLETIFQQKKE